MDKLKRVIIKEEYVAITNDTFEAIVLNQMIYWSERVKDFDKFIKEEAERKEKFMPSSEDEETEELELTHGWIYKKAAELKNEIMSTDSEKTINRKLSSLVKKGFLDRRTNPKIKYDRTYQYRVNFPNIIKSLIEKGYMMQDYKVDLNFIAEALKTLNGQNDESNSHDNNESKRQIDDLKNQIVALKEQIDVLKENSGGAIPEITIETTSETITESSISLPVDNFFKSIKSEMTDVSYKTFIEPLVIKQEENKIQIITSSDFIKGMIKNKFIKLIEIHLKKYFEFEHIEVAVEEKLKEG